MFDAVCSSVSSSFCGLHFAICAICGVMLFLYCISSKWKHNSSLNTEFRVSMIFCEALQRSHLAVMS